MWMSLRGRRLVLFGTGRARYRGIGRVRGHGNHSHSGSGSTSSRSHNGSSISLNGEVKDTVADARDWGAVTLVAGAGADCDTLAGEFVDGRTDGLKLGLDFTM